MKNAWEAVRDPPLRYGTRATHKHKVIANRRDRVPDSPGREMGNRMWDFYSNGAPTPAGSPASLIDAFRKQLHNSTLDAISQFLE